MMTVQSDTSTTKTQAKIQNELLKQQLRGTSKIAAAMLDNSADDTVFKHHAKSNSKHNECNSRDDESNRRNNFSFYIFQRRKSIS